MSCEKKGSIFDTRNIKWQTHSMLLQGKCK